MSSAERRWRRVKLDVRVKLWRKEGGQESATVLRSFELSQGGMSVYAPEPMEMGTLVAVSFTLPGATAALRLHAVVRNQHGFRCGLEFVRVCEAEQAELARYFGSVADAAGESFEGTAKA